MTTHKNNLTMKPAAARLLRTLTLLALLVAANSPSVHAQTDSNVQFAAAIQNPDTARSESASPIEGAWIFTNTRINQGGFTFTALGLFAAGGVFTATGSIDRTDPISPLMGSWKRTEFNRFQSTAHFFAFDPTRKAVAMIKVNQTFQLTNSNDMIGTGLGFACDLNGAKCVAVPEVTIKITAKRIVTETMCGCEKQWLSLEPKERLKH